MRWCHVTMALTTAQKLEAALDVSPLTVLTLGVLAWIFPPGSFPGLFRRFAPNQWDRKLTISAITWLMLDVVTGARSSVHSAYQADVRSKDRDAPPAERHDLTPERSRR